MQLKRFSVKGFKNFRQEIVLYNMGVICVIHGENNVGKSNVLEAMLLFFKLYDTLLASYESSLYDEELEKLEELDISLEQLEQLGFKASEIFSFGLETPITMSATLTFEEAECENKSFDITITLQKVNEEFKVITNLSQKFEFFFRDVFNNPFALVGVDRLISESERESVRYLVPQTLLLKLYDMKDSPEPSIFEKWELFVSTLQKFKDILGEGEFISVFNRLSNRANLVFQPKSKPRRRIPIEILGSGIQQVVALVARLLVSEATCIAIEEPELNLRYTLQLRLREIFDDIVKAPVGPKQLFLSSHSPAFEFGQHFYAMNADNDGPTIKHLPIKQAHLFTEHDTNAPNLYETAPQCYVSSDRLVRLPEDICQQLGLEQGGGIVILKREDNKHVELLTNEQFFELLEPVNS